MSLPATWLALRNVGTAGDQGPDSAPCADPQVRGLLRRRQFEQWPIRTHDVPDLQRRDIREFPQAPAAPADPGTAHAPRARQRPLSSRHTPGSVSASSCPRSAAAVLAALQPATGPHRARLEADSAARDAQPVLCNAPRGAQGGQRVLQPVAPTERRVTTIMLQYLSRCV